LNFAIIGAAGYIAPRHFSAIKELEGSVVAAYDLHDSVGQLDSFFPSAEFFTIFEEFAVYVSERAAGEEKIDYVVVCSPNFLHVAHIKFALRLGINVICEKPLVLTVKDLNEISQYEKSFGARVYSILQLRLHPTIIDLQKATVAGKSGEGVVAGEVTYITSRGSWYSKSWKGDTRKSGGVATNIGIHFFDMLHYLFGESKSNDVHFRSETTTAGCLKFESVSIRWFLSTDESYLPSNFVSGDKKTFRNIVIGDRSVEFSGGFEDLHRASYREILADRGFGIQCTRSAIKTVEELRSKPVSLPNTDVHPMLKLVTAR